MGMLGPLTAQALGRSPYDEVVEGEGPENPREPTQQYDHRGRPINPETKRINRDIIRSHNEVMQVIGVAEPDPAASLPEIESHVRHEAYEEVIGMKIAASSSYCVEAVGVFGLHGLRQRILIYTRYSKIPFWELYKQARSSHSLTTDILAGAPVSLAINYVERFVAPLWFDDDARWFARRCADDVWMYIRLHLELYVAFQRLGLVSNSFWLPSPRYFIPFTSASPIPMPPPLDGFSADALLRWMGGVVVSAAPFLAWFMVKQMAKDWSLQICSTIFQQLPNTVFRGKKYTFPEPHEGAEHHHQPQQQAGTSRLFNETQDDGNSPPPAPYTVPAVDSTSEVEQPISTGQSVPNVNYTMPQRNQTTSADQGTTEMNSAIPQPGQTIPTSQTTPQANHAGPDHSASTASEGSGHLPGHSRQRPPPPVAAQTTRRLSVLSGRGDDSDGEENEGISATLISFDVEATESTDAPPGLWSAELRPSVAADGRSMLKPLPLYLDTLLTQLPALISSHALGNVGARILMCPYEAAVLRLVALAFCQQAGVPCADILSPHLLSGLNWTFAVNYLGSELLHLVLMGDVWATFTGISQWFHMSESEWKAEESKPLSEANFSFVSDMQARGIFR